MALTRPKTQETPTDEPRLSEEGVKATAEQAPDETTEQPAAEQDQQSSVDTPDPAATATPEQASAPEALRSDTPAQAQPPAEAPQRHEVTSGAKRMMEASQEMAEDGMEGMTLGGMSFERIRLPAEGQFLIGQEDTELGKTFQCVIQAARPQYVVKASDERDADLFYSYDAAGMTNAEGESMADKRQEWAEDGYDHPIIKKYLEVWAILLDPQGERDRMMVSLSIPPASEQRFAGFIYQQRMMKKLKQHEFITECYVAKKVKGNKGEAFFPWGFKNVGAAPELF